MPWLSWNLIQVTGERAKCNRGRAYNEYKKRFVKRGFNLTILIETIFGDTFSLDIKQFFGSLFCNVYAYKFMLCECTGVSSDRKEERDRIKKGEGS